MSWIDNTKKLWWIHREDSYCNIHTFDVMAEKLTTELFIERARKVHGDRYDYSKVEYVNAITKVCVVCKIHGEFWQRPNDHLNGGGCVMCAREGNIAVRKRWTKESCFEEAKKYSTSHDFREYSTAYTAATKNGWIKEYTWLTKQKHTEWTREDCEQEARKYKTRDEFHRSSGSAYNAAKRNGWLDDYTWHTMQRQIEWTYENCMLESQKYMNKRDFQTTSGSAYNASRRNGWLKDFVWLRPLRKQWDYSSCFEEARKHDSLKGFATSSPSAYSCARKNKWLDDYVWFKLQRRRPWTNEEIKEIASTFCSKKDFFEKNNQAFQAARKRNLIETFDWLRDERIDLYTDTIDSVYIYHFEKQHAVYVGRSIHPDERDKQHLFSENDTVSKFAKENSIPIPPMLVIESELTLEQGQVREEFWIQHYKEAGYNVLNKAKSGIGIGSLGSLGGYKWTKKNCRVESLKYDSIDDFRRGSYQAYLTARSKGWVSEYVWLTPAKIIKLADEWDYDSCLAEAKKHMTKKAFVQDCPRAYEWARRNGWLQHYSWLRNAKRESKWNYETCIEEARKYKTLKDFCNNSSSAYSMARKHGWLLQFSWLKRKQKPKGYWTKERCYEEAKKYKSRKEFEANVPTAYMKSLRYKWIDEYNWFTPTSKLLSAHQRKWNYETCKEESKKYSSRGEFSEMCSSAWAVAKKKGWLDEYTWLVPKKRENGYWNHDICFEEARKYTSKKDFKNGSQSAFDAAKRHGWLSEYTWFKVLWRPKWDYKACKSEAAKYTCRSEFQRCKGSAYQASKRNGWIDEFFPKKEKK